MTFSKPMVEQLVRLNRFPIEKVGREFESQRELMFGGDCSVTVIVVGNGLGAQSSNPGRVFTFQFVQITSGKAIIYLLSPYL